MCNRRDEQLAKSPLQAINRERGTCYFCQAAWAGISKELCLSGEEVDILQCLLLGDNDRQAADFLGVAFCTVRTHLERLHRKLGVHTRMELTVRLFDAHCDWLCKEGPPQGCRMIVRLARKQ